jgi:uncharacterized membrane protein YsdA (DUF1294 family)
VFAFRFRRIRRRFFWSPALDGGRLGVLATRVTFGH